MLDKTKDNMRNNSKRSVSFRIDNNDFEKIKAITRRLRIRESDIFRFAIKMTLDKLSPLSDENMKGIDVMPVFVECGSDITVHFNLDSTRIEHIINDGVDDEEDRVDMEDIGLLAMSAMPERYLTAKLKNIINKPIQKEGVAEALRDYLHDKYLEKQSGH